MTSDRSAAERSTRVVVVGTSGCGKTTFARQLAVLLRVPHVELDYLYWGPNWTERPTDLFRADVTEALAQPAWVCDGNYSAVRDIVWPRANTLVWLDFSFPLVFYRAVVRTLTRMVTREELFAGNRESWRLMFGRDWIPWWVVRTFHRRRVQYGGLLRDASYAHLQVLRFTTPDEARAYLGRLETH